MLNGAKANCGVVMLLLRAAGLADTQLLCSFMLKTQDLNQSGPLLHAYAQLAIGALVFLPASFEHSLLC